jgi:hypothetical protein
MKLSLRASLLAAGLALVATLTTIRYVVETTATARMLHTLQGLSWEIDVAHVNTHTVREYIAEQRMRPADLARRWRARSAFTADKCPRVVVPSGHFLSPTLWVDADIASGFACITDAGVGFTAAHVADSDSFIDMSVVKQQLGGNQLPPCRGPQSLIGLKRGEADDDYEFAVASYDSDDPPAVQLAAHMLAGRTVLMYGDSTMRQLAMAAHALLGLHAMNNEEAKAFVRGSCPYQIEPEGYARTACGNNERLCTFSLPLRNDSRAADAEDASDAKTLRIVYDWKHFLWTRHDDYFTARVAESLYDADIVVINVGNHDCAHGEFPLADRHAWETLEKRMHKFLSQIYQHLRHRAKVILVDNTWFGVQEMSRACMLWMNALMREAAVEYGLYLLSREVIGDSYLLQNGTVLDVHLPDHVIEIEMHYLLGMWECLLSEG